MIAHAPTQFVALTRKAMLGTGIVIAAALEYQYINAIVDQLSCGEPCHQSAADKDYLSRF